MHFGSSIVVLLGVDYAVHQPHAAKVHGCHEYDVTQYPAGVARKESSEGAREYSTRIYSTQI